MTLPQALLDHAEEVAGAVAGALPANAVPNCTMSKQEMTEWCWAAVTQTIEGVRGNTVEQCIIAQDLMPTLDCCNNKESCNQEEDLDHVLSTRNIPCHPAGGKVGLQAITDAIDGGQPVGCRISFSGTQHLILISAYEGDHLTFLDPALEHPMEPNEQPYDDFLLRYQATGKWNETYFFS